jgi:hypothetical protein
VTPRDSITLCIAAIGAVLGVINTVTSLNQQRVKLVVRAKHATFFSGGEFGEDMGCIEVTNLSSFPVFVSEIGFELVGRRDRLAIPTPITTDQKPFARKLESRASVTGYFDLPAHHQRDGKSYVKTDCGEKRLGNRLT